MKIYTITKAQGFMSRKKSMENIVVIDEDTGCEISTSDWEIIKQSEHMVRLKFNNDLENKNITKLLNMATHIIIEGEVLEINIENIINSTVAKSITFNYTCMVYGNAKGRNIDVYCPYSMRDLFKELNITVYTDEATAQELAMESYQIKSDALGKKIRKYRLQSERDAVLDIINAIDDRDWDTMMDFVIDRLTYAYTTSSNYLGYFIQFSMKDTIALDRDYEKKLRGRDSTGKFFVLDYFDTETGTSSVHAVRVDRDYFRKDNFYTNKELRQLGNSIFSTVEISLKVITLEVNGEQLEDLNVLINKED